MSVYRPTYRDAKTGEKKQQDVWWYHFTFAGRHIQESSKSARKTVAVEAEKRRRRELEQAHAGIPTDTDRGNRVRTVKAAVRDYREAYAVAHRAKSVAWVGERTAHVERLLGSLILPDLTEKRVVEYMATRQKEKAGNRTINMEVDCLARAVGRPWRQLWPKVKRLEEARDTGRALSPEEERALLEQAAKNKSPFVLPFIKIALLTGMRFGEIRGLRWSQIDLANRILTVGKAKTAAGSGRVVPMGAGLSATLEGQASWLSGKLGGTIQPEWYVFPFSTGVRPEDPTRPVTTIKTAWEAVRKAAGVFCRLHDLRHTACTKMAEAGVPEETMKALMGHMSRAMIERYSHIRMNAKRAAIEALELHSANGAAKESAKVSHSPLVQ